MAASLKAPQVSRLDLSIDKSIYDTFMKTCTKKGYSPKVMVEKLLKKYNETGQF